MGARAEISLVGDLLLHPEEEEFSVTRLSGGGIEIMGGAGPRPADETHR